MLHLQDVYNVRLRETGFDLDLGIKGSDKKTTRYLENKVITINKVLDNAVNNFEEKMKTTKSTFIDKEYVKVKSNGISTKNGTTI